MNILSFLYNFVKTLFKSDLQKDMEILALRSQLAVFQEQLTKQKITRPNVTDRFRRLWVFLSKVYPRWKDALILVKPETVIGWHKRAFKLFWRRKSKVGRPKISPATIALIKRIHRENPTLSPEKIHERLLDMNIADTPAPNTISKYIRAPHRPSTEKQKQSWKSFLRNQAKGTWSMDFAVVPTLLFKPLYVFLIISHGRRKIEHFAVTDHPTAAWVTQHVRNATSFGDQPEYLLHDNDAAFKDQGFQ